MTRAVPEWIGKTDDSAIPPRVRLRVFARYDGVCYLSDRKITASDKWEAEHIIAIINGGQNRESNLAPALVVPHKVKSAADMKQKSKNYRVRAKHTGIKKPSRFPGSRDSKFKKRMNGNVVLR